MPALTGGAAILARLKAQKAARSQKANETRTVTILYASQTGTAQDIALSIHAECPAKNIKSKVMSCNELGFANVSALKSSLLVFVISSTGDGDAPDNSTTFFRDMKRPLPTDHLKGVKYTLLGLGDSNYTSFMQVPRDFRRKLRDLGAEVFYDCVEADEVDGLDDITDDWVDSLWEPLGKVAKGESVNGTAPPPAAPAKAAPQTAGRSDAESKATESHPMRLSDLDMSGTTPEGVPALPGCRVAVEWEVNEAKVAEVINREQSCPLEAELAHRQSDGEYSPEQPFWADVTDARLMTADWSDRRVIHVEVDLEGSNIQYSPGDSLGVVAQNSEASVRSLLERLSVPGDQVFGVKASQDESTQELLPHLHCPCTVRHALMHGCDLTSIPRKTLLRYLAEQCSDQCDKSKLLYLCSRSGKDAYKSYVLDAQPSLLDILSSFPSCKPSLAGLLDLLPPLPPRMYSVTTSQDAHPNKAQFAFTLAKFTTPYGAREGVATSWMDKILTPVLEGTESGQVKLPVFSRSGGAFGAPEDLSKPWIMIGPGTGVAPFRGFLETRRLKLQGYKGPVGPCWLFFGCRKESEDYLYKEDLQGFLDDGTLSKMELAFSREQAEKIYVQHRMKQNSQALYELIFQQEGFVFVCGDGQDMAKAVHGCLNDMLKEHGGLSEKEANDKLMEMTRGRQYVRDVWS
ncbi:hypothetical protein BSKO_00662 [Bryopsis sp. KO-2023]|nr:hypothetical protein BSKO_00662 [Bryopsis sp. KO-2023]